MEIPAPNKIPRWSPRQVISATLMIAAILALFFLLYRFRNIIFILFIAIVLSTGIRPIVNMLSRHGISRSKGVILLYLSGLSLIVLLGLFAFPLILEQVTEISRNLPAYYGNFRNSLSNSSSHILAQIATHLPAGIWLLATNITSGSGKSLTQVTNSFFYVDSFVRVVFTLTAILILGFSWTLESERAVRNLLLWVPSDRRDRYREFILEAEDKVGRFIFGQGILCLSIGGMALVAYLLMGLPYALVLAIIAAIMEAVPIVGPALGAIAAILVAFSFDPSKIVWVVVSTLLIQGLENYLLVPRIMKSAVGVNPLVVLLTIAAFTTLFGFAGAVLSIPIAAIIQLSIDRFVIQPSSVVEPSSDGRGQVSLLRYEAQNLSQDLRKQLRQGDQLEIPTDVMVDSLEAIARDLDQFLAETEESLSKN